MKIPPYDDVLDDAIRIFGTFVYGCFLISDNTPSGYTLYFDDCGFKVYLTNLPTVANLYKPIVDMNDLSTFNIPELLDVNINRDKYIDIVRGLIIERIDEKLKKLYVDARQNWK